jgi:hypothetical protein
VHLRKVRALLKGVVVATVICFSIFTERHKVRIVMEKLSTEAS